MGPQPGVQDAPLQSAELFAPGARSVSNTQASSIGRVRGGLGQQFVLRPESTSARRQIPGADFTSTIVRRSPESIPCRASDCAEWAGIGVGCIFSRKANPWRATYASISSHTSQKRAADLQRHPSDVSASSMGAFPPPLPAEPRNRLKRNVVSTLIVGAWWARKSRGQSRFRATCGEKSKARFSRRGFEGLPAPLWPRPRHPAAGQSPCLQTVLPGELGDEARHPPRCPDAGHGPDGRRSGRGRPARATDEEEPRNRALRKRRSSSVRPGRPRFIRGFDRRQRHPRRASAI